MSGPKRSEIESLRAARPRSRFLLISTVALILLAVYGIISVAVRSDGFLGERQNRNLSRVLEEIRPHGEDNQVLPLAEYGTWAGSLLRDRGYDAAATTLAISVLAIVLAGLISLPLCLLAARTIATPEAFAPAARLPHAV